MAEVSPHRGGATIGPLLLAVIFLAILGGGVGYSLGALARHQRNLSATQTDTAGQDNGTGQRNGTGGGHGAGTGGGQNGKPPCPDLVVAQAQAGPLSKLLYLHTARSEVWICEDAKGTLYYQGHRGPQGEPIVEDSNGIFLRAVQREGGDGYLATNTDQQGHTIEYHVTPTQLVIRYYDYQPPKPDETENAT